MGEMADDIACLADQYEYIFENNQRGYKAMAAKKTATGEVLAVYTDKSIKSFKLRTTKGNEVYMGTYKDVPEVNAGDIVEVRYTTKKQNDKTFYNTKNQDITVTQAAPKAPAGKTNGGAVGTGFRSPAELNRTEALSHAIDLTKYAIDKEAIKLGTKTTKPADKFDLLVEATLQVAEGFRSYIVDSDEDSEDDDLDGKDSEDDDLSDDMDDDIDDDDDGGL